MEITKDLFELVPDNEKDKEGVARPSMTYLQDAWRRLKQNKLALLGLAVIVLMTLAAIFIPMFSHYDYSTQDFKIANQGASAAHIFGTDKFGRDIFTRVAYGARISLTVAFVASALNVLIGIIYGGVSGYFGGWVDMVMMRIVDILNSIPMLIYVILISVALGSRDIKGIIIAMTISMWTTMARIVRGQILTLKEQEFVLAAKTLGVKPFAIIFRHLIPNSMGSIIVTLTLAIPEAIFTESFLSFVGVGISAPKASWGTLASEAVEMMRTHPSQLLIPSLAICITVFAFNMLGDGLRDALDPKMRK
ncbi:ABC transporter permease [Clostridium folliculivorans]|uniref:Peptide ABC transporter permease n=1 Tax=Clostridium folliculivorans TaxID=2886038 RepID=A0A9W5XYQ6_9CLOT|nr:ABC transporter permease [Clostridium folliculivorans]GKU23351.1 peptide ABC transporter permease [Clostridium folliculivorans]GKU29468.1 peptide ABC transporter permease [Clostridium folliculivorans]